jgi:anti-sigma regulatory factor (Ser/Thr protein kinase)
MILSIPYQFEGITLSRVIAPLLADDVDRLPHQLSIDFGSLGFIKPTGVAFLGNLVQWLRVHGCKVQFVNTGGKTPAIKYLDDSMFFHQFLGKKIDPSSAVRRTTVPLAPVCHADCHAWIRMTLMPWLASAIGINIESLYTLQVSLQELFNNIKDHTQFDIGTIFVQYYPKPQNMVIAISDFGPGIPENVRKVIDGLPDGHAIIQAVREGFTSKSTPSNSGIGLDYLIRTVVCELRGIVTIYSCGGIVRFYRSTAGYSTFDYPGVGFCPGSTFSIELSADAIPTVSGEIGELQW